MRRIGLFISWELLFFKKPEALDKAFAVAPVLFDLDPCLEVDLNTEEVLEFMTGGGSGFFYHRTIFADDNTLMRFALTIDCDRNIEEVFILTFGELFGYNGNAMRHFIAEELEELFADELGSEYPFGLIGQHIFGEVMRAGLCEPEQLIHDNGNAVISEDADGDERMRMPAFLCGSQERREL